MTRSELKAQLDKAKQEMEELLQDKTLLDMRIGHLSETINAMMSLLAAKPTEPTLPNELFGESGITGAIRFLLAHSNLPLSPMQIRDGLEKRGFDLSDYANAMAVIHNTLKRLEGQGELTTVKDPSGQVIGYMVLGFEQRSKNALADRVAMAERIAESEKVLAHNIGQTAEAMLDTSHPVMKIRKRPIPRTGGTIRDWMALQEPPKKK